ncbi:MAG: GNAT family N-acetyltransferase [Anaerolineae bacterium]|nr:GNAT family N-acetyltransferase [Anaerolineae bacterium]
MRLLIHPDLPQLERVLARDPYYNLFMIGNLAQMGIDHPDLFYWGQFDGDDLIGVVMRYRNNWLFYDAGGADLNAIAQLIDAYPDDVNINGRSMLVNAIIERLTMFEVKADHQSYYCALPGDASLPVPAHFTRRATGQDISVLVVLYAQAGHMSRDAASIRGCLSRNRIWVTLVDDQIVSAALTNVEAASMAMVGGVFTPESLRNRGYASAAMAALCADLVADGLQPCLFYDNPAAGKIYRRLGFEDIGPWRYVQMRRRTKREA